MVVKCSLRSGMLWDPISTRPYLVLYLVRLYFSMRPKNLTHPPGLPACPYSRLPPMPLDWSDRYYSPISFLSFSISFRLSPTLPLLNVTQSYFVTFSNFQKVAYHATSSVLPDIWSLYSYSVITLYLYLNPIVNQVTPVGLQ